MSVEVTSAKKGFSLIELMVVLTILGIISAIAYPSYQSRVSKSKRSDAKEALLRIQLAQEKWRVSDTDYATHAELGNPSTDGGYYAINISDNTATGYTIRATGVGGQANDSVGTTSCSPLELIVSAGGESKAPADCW